MVSVVVAAFCGGRILPCVLLVCLSEMGLEVDVCFVNWRLGSPLAARLGKKNGVALMSATPVRILLASVMASFPRIEKA